jgi:hypothetical protein
MDKEIHKKPYINEKSLKILKRRNKSNDSTINIHSKLYEDAKLIKINKENMTKKYKKLEKDELNNVKKNIKENIEKSNKI